MTAADLATPPLAAPSSTIFAHVAEQAAAVAHFSARLAFETDVSDVAAGLRDEPGAFVVVDTRSAESWAQGHVPGAVHLPTRRIAAEASELIAPGAPVVVYCWGPGTRNGDGTGQPRYTPTPVSGLADATEISANNEHACARRVDGTIWCWGDNTYRQLGDGTVTSPRLAPVKNTVF